MVELERDVLDVRLVLFRDQGSPLALDVRSLVARSMVLDLSHTVLSVKAENSRTAPVVYSSQMTQEGCSTYP